MLDAESLQQIAVAVADEIERRRRAEEWNAQVREYLLLRNRALNRQVDLPAASQANLRDLSHQWYWPPQISPDPPSRIHRCVARIADLMRGFASRAWR